VVGRTAGTGLPGHVGRCAAFLIEPRPLIHINLGIRKVDEMGSWLVPPIVIPVLIVIMVVVYGLYRLYS
jgi:hypothetical protein